MAPLSSATVDMWHYQFLFTIKIEVIYLSF